MPSNSDMLFGKLAVKNKFLTEAQLGEAMLKQGELESVGIAQSLPHLLAERGYLTIDKVEKILKLQKYLEMREDDKRFGAIALRGRFASEEQLHECLTIQYEFFQQGVQPLQRLGELLVQKGYISDQQKEAILKTQAQGVKLGPAPSSAADAFQSVLPGTAADSNVCPVCSKLNLLSALRCAVCGSALSRPPSARISATPTPIRIAAEAAQLEATLFGKIAVDEQFIPQYQLDECLEIQKEVRAKGVQRKIGQILEGKSYMLKDQVDRVLGLQTARRGLLDVSDVGPARTYMPPIGEGAPLRTPPPKPIEVRQNDRVVKYYPKVLLFRLIDNLTSLAWLGAIVAAIVLGTIFVPSLWESAPREKEEKTVRNPDREFQKAQAYEEDNTATGGFDDIREKYRQIVNDFAGTEAARKAVKRGAELDALYAQAEEKFRKTKVSAETLTNAGSAAEAYKLCDDLIDFLDTVPGRPFKGESVRIKLDVLAAAVSQVSAQVTKARAAVERGDLTKAEEICTELKNSRISQVAQEVRSLVVELDDELTVLLKKKRRDDADRAEQAAAVKKKTEQHKNLIAAGRQLEAASKFDQALWTYGKALAVASNAQEIAGAKSDQRRVVEIVTEQCSSLKAKLQVVKNCCIQGMIPEAVEKCEPLCKDKKYLTFSEDITTLFNDLKKAQTESAMRLTITRAVDLLSNKVQSWTDAALQPPPDMNCGSCQGVGTVVCAKCTGIGKRQDQRCPDCAQVIGLKQCDKCVEGLVKCYKCKGHGKMQQIQWLNKACPLCGGSGYFRGMSCQRCAGSGYVREGKPLGLVSCETCKGTGQSKKDCPDCEKGYANCVRCDGTGYIGKVCEDCLGLGKVGCTACNGSGIDAEKVE